MAKERDEARPPQRPVDSVRVGTAHAAPGAVRHGRVWATGYVPDLMPPLTLVGGARAGPVVAVLAGLHGDEATAVEAVRRLAERLDPEQMAGTAILVPVVNVPGFRDRRPQVNPLDGQDLERAFPGAPRGGPTTRLAHALTDQVVAVADAVLEVRSGGSVLEGLPFCLVEPGVGEATADGADLAWARAVGGDVVVARRPRSLLAAARALGKRSLLVHGGGGGYRPEDAEPLTDALLRALAHFGIAVGAGGAAPPPGQVLTWTWLMAPADGYWRPLLPLGAAAAAGEAVGEVAPLEGGGRRPVAVLAPEAGRVLMRCAALAARTGSALAVLAAPAATT